MSALDDLSRALAAKWLKDQEIPLIFGPLNEWSPAEVESWTFRGYSGLGEPLPGRDLPVWLL